MKKLEFPISEKKHHGNKQLFL